MINSSASTGTPSTAASIATISEATDLVATTSLATEPKATASKTTETKASTVPTSSTETTTFIPATLPTRRKTTTTKGNEITTNTEIAKISSQSSAETTAASKILSFLNGLVTIPGLLI